MDTTTSSTTTPQEEEGSENLESLKGGLRFSALDLAPDFTLLDEYKNPVSLHDYRGKHVLVHFYNTDEKRGIVHTVDAFKKLWEELEALQLNVILVGRDSEDSHKHFKEHHSIPFPILSDPDRLCGLLYDTVLGPNIVRSSVLVDPQGRILKVWTKNAASSPLHPQDVVSFLQHHHHRQKEE